MEGPGLVGPYPRRTLPTHVSNLSLWEELLGFLNSTFQDIKWVKIPCHVNVEGNEQANTLANERCLQKSLKPPKGTPRGKSGA